MAFAPCSHGKHPFRGKSAAAYVALSQGSEMARERLRLCQDHALEVETFLGQFEVGDDSPPLAERSGFPCMHCGDETLAVDRRMVFVTTYFVGQDRRDFWGMLHGGCDLPPQLVPRAAV